MSEHDFLNTVSKIEGIAYSKAEIKMCDFPFDKYTEFKNYKSKLASKSKKIDKSILVYHV